MTYVSVILCTYNRCDSLARALRSLAVSQMPVSVDWEVLVVDNNSSDRTRVVVEELCRLYPRRFRYLFEPQQGKSHALNAGIGAAHGDVLAFVDDDVTVPATWLQNLTEPLRDNQWAGCGGRVLPAPGFSAPRWLALTGPNSLIGALCAYFEPDQPAGDLKIPPIGANMGFRKQIFEEYGGFRTDLGPHPENEIRSEDTEFARRVMLGGERLVYVPSAVVYHEVHEKRIRKGFFLAWWFDFGRGSVRETGKGQTPGKIAKVLVRIVYTAFLWMLSFSPERRFYLKCRVWFNAGKLAESYRQTKRNMPAKHNFRHQAGREGAARISRT